MIQSQISNTARQALTDIIIAAKAEKNLSFEQIAEGTGLSDVFVTAAL
ncbi:Cyanase [Altererythrobacter insulae]|nr:Cyanase [Altererythrobacter insulae]